MSEKAKNTSKVETAINWVFLWGARGVMALLAGAGTVHVLDGVDRLISVPIAVVLVGLLVRETL